MNKTFDEVHNNATHRKAALKSLLKLTPEARHRVFLETYDKYHGKNAAAARAELIRRPSTTDAQVLRDSYRFIRNAEDDAEDSWEARMARRYYAKLFKEYAIADLSRYAEHNIGLRWRIEKEVVSGKGQFSCGNKKCDARDGLGSFELNFAYQENGERKSALVKVRACPTCADKLNFGRSAALKPQPRARKRPRRTITKREDGASRSESDEDDDDDDDESDEDEDTKAARAVDAAMGPSGDADEGIWSGAAKNTDAPSKEEEFDAYFSDMFA